jgi:hypothetical protein
MRHRTIPTLAAAALLAGCGTTATVQERPEPEPVAATTSEPAPRPEPVEVESRTASWGPYASVEGTLMRPRRRGATIVVTLRLRGPEDRLVTLEGAFDDGEEQAGTSNTVDGISVIDPQNGRRHTVARTPDGACVCSDRLGDLAEEQTISATFAAPPPDVESIDVVVPQFGTFTDVPLA